MSDETFWLTVTNISLGAVAAACIVLFVKVILQDILHRTRGSSPPDTAGDGKGLSSSETYRRRMR
jgi:hypothetical protein